MAVFRVHRVWREGKSCVYNESRVQQIANFGSQGQPSRCFMQYKHVKPPRQWQSLWSRKCCHGAWEVLPTGWRQLQQNHCRELDKSVTITAARSWAWSPCGDSAALPKRSTMMASMATYIWVNIVSGNGLLPDGTKPQPEPVLTFHQWGPVALICGTIF